MEKLTMQIYEKPVWGLMHEMVDDMGLSRRDRLKKQEAKDWFKKNYPKINESTVAAHLIRMSTNAPSRVHYHAKPEQDDLFFQIDGSTFRLYDPDTDPPPIYERDQQKDISLSEKIRSLVKDYEHTQESKLNSAQQRIRELETELSLLESELEEGDALLEIIGDQKLKDRLEKLGSAPSDTIIREAGVILEDRLRIISGIRRNLHGAKLIDAIFNPDDGVLVFSDHPGEQEGVRMLYRGAMQFIRNPPMHKLMDYSDRALTLFIRMIDSLLQLLTELDHRYRGEVTVSDVRQMLRRRKIPRGQMDLYRELYKHKGEWVSADTLSKDIGRTKSQLAGVLGALGRRINNTEGLEGKGGIKVVFDVKKEGEEWCYRMNKLLIDALKQESVLNT
jgi:hypothetical protein